MGKNGGLVVSGWTFLGRAGTTAVGSDGRHLTGATMPWVVVEDVGIYRLPTGGGARSDVFF